VILILKYTNDTVAEYWDSPEHRIFTMKMNSDNHLMLLSSNKTNSRLYNISENGIGKTLYEIMALEHAERWHLRYEEWKKSRFTTYTARFEDISEAWETTIEIINGTIFAIGQRVDPDRLKFETLENHDVFNHYLIQTDDFSVITLLPQDDDVFIIESIDSSINNANNYIKNDISSITLYCSNILDKSVLKKCIQTGKTIHLAEKFAKDDITLFFDVSIYPYLNRSKIIVYAKIINETTYYQIQKKIGNMYGNYPDVDYLGICEINYEDSNNPYVIGCNTYFKTILEKSDLNLESIISSNPFQQCLHTLATETGSLSVKNKFGEHIYYKISVTHYSEVRSDVFIITLLPEEQELLTLDFENLSVREKEVIEHVVKGATNRYIAQALHISEGTVKKTIYNAFKKLGIGSRYELIKLIKE
jgi:DNA-binding CsgD family transcriptional regulator